MRSVRRLTVRRNSLTELLPDDLVTVAAGQEITEPNCKVPTLWQSCLCMTEPPPPTGMC